MESVNVFAYIADVRYTLFTIIILLLSSLELIAQSAGTIPKELNGEWVLRSYYLTQNDWGISRKQAQSLIGSKLIYRDGALSACKQRVAIDKVVQRDMSSTEFLAGNNVRFGDVGIVGPSVREIRLNAGIGDCFGTFTLPGEDAYLKSRDELLIDFEGVYFRATRASPEEGAH